MGFYFSHEVATFFGTSVTSQNEDLAMRLEFGIGAAKLYQPWGKPNRFRTIQASNCLVGLLRHLACHWRLPFTKWIGGTGGQYAYTGRTGLSTSPVNKLLFREPSPVKSASRNVAFALGKLGHLPTSVSCKDAARSEVDR
jgi:hypothetical protein